MIETIVHIRRLWTHGMAAVRVYEYWAMEKQTILLAHPLELAVALLAAQYHCSDSSQITLGYTFGVYFADDFNFELLFLTWLATFLTLSIFKDSVIKQRVEEKRIWRSGDCITWDRSIFPMEFCWGLDNQNLCFEWYQSKFHSWKRIFVPGMNTTWYELKSFFFLEIDPFFRLFLFLDVFHFYRVWFIFYRNEKRNIQLWIQNDPSYWIFQ